MESPRPNAACRTSRTCLVWRVHLRGFDITSRLTVTSTMSSRSTRSVIGTVWHARFAVKEGVDVKGDGHGALISDTTVGQEDLM